jgi:predicted nucleic acid-binding protein
VRAILDTSVLIAVAQDELQGDGLEGELAISTVSLAEIHFGVLVARDDLVRARRLRLLTTVERTFDSLPVDDAVAASYGELAATVAALGRQPRSRSMDLLIAATAHAHGARLYTSNPGDLLGADQLVEVVGV